MAVPGPKSDLRRSLETGRDALRWKLDGLSEYDLRRPLTPTGTNLLGLLKHVAGVAAGYFGLVFGRPFPQPLPWYDDGAEANADMWATEEETTAQILDLYREAWAHADATIDALPLDATGFVPHWPPERAEVTLHQVLVHMIAETHRHAGHADIIREVIDGAVGLRADNDNMAPGDEAWWDDHRGRLERAARSAADPASEHRRPATRGRAPRTGRTLAVTGTVLDVASTVRAGPAVSGPGSGPRASRRRP